MAARAVFGSRSSLQLLGWVGPPMEGREMGGLPPVQWGVRRAACGVCAGLGCPWRAGGEALGEVVGGRKGGRRKP